jgi:hypothetical protein
MYHTIIACRKTIATTVRDYLYILPTPVAISLDVKIIFNGYSLGIAQYTLNFFFLRIINIHGTLHPTIYTYS